MRAAALTCLLAAAALGATPAGAAPRRGPNPFVWHALPRLDRPVVHAASIRRRTWLRHVVITEYYPAPEKWALGIPVATPGLRSKHRIDWLYGALGVTMEGTGLGVDGRFYHADDLGRGAWVTRSGKPTFDGVHDNGPPYWRAGGYWRNSHRGVTFRLLRGGWSNDVGRRWIGPPKGISFASGAGTPGLRYYRTIAVDPDLIPLGSMVYVPYYRSINHNGGWFQAVDTGGAIIGRHIDVYRPPPDIVDDPGRYLTNQRILVVPPPR